MRRLPRVYGLALSLTILFVCVCSVVFWMRNAGGEPQVLTAGKEVPVAVSTSEEEEWPVSLLPGEQIDLNAAPVRDLARLPMIGEKRAADIAAFRQTHGPFRTLEELMKVSGIGEGIFEQIKPYITVTGAE